MSNHNVTQLVARLNAAAGTLKKLHTFFFSANKPTVTSNKFTDIDHTVHWRRLEADKEFLSNARQRFWKVCNAET